MSDKTIKTERAAAMKPVLRVVRYMLHYYKYPFMLVVACILIGAVATVIGATFPQKLVDEYILPMLAEGSSDFSGLKTDLIQLACVMGVGVIAAFSYNRIMVNGAYVLSGSGYNFKEALEGYFWLAVFALAGRGLLWLSRRVARRRDLLLRAAAGALALALIALAGLDAARWPSAVHNGQYLEALGGYTTYQKALVELPEVTSGEPVFSVYATGLEAVEGVFQPSGCDYIIHALGDKTREKYVASFTDGGWAWAQTPRMDLENWLTVQNWDVYRHLWAGYERCYATEYSWLWRACSDRSLPVEAQVSAQRQSDSGWTITVSAPAGESFTADLYVRWESGFTSPWGAFLSLGRSMVGCAVPLFGDMPGVAGYLPASGEAYIPVRVENGQGTATLWSADGAFTELTITEARFERALPALDLYEQEAAQ